LSITDDTIGVMKHYKIAPQSQINNNCCAQASLSMLLSYYDEDYSQDLILEKVPTVKDEDGEAVGSLIPQLAEWCTELGYKTNLISYDFTITDYYWQDKSQNEILEAFKSIQDTTDYPGLGKYYSKEYVKAYISFIEKGGNLIVRPYLSVSELKKMLDKSPLHMSVSYSGLYGVGRTKNNKEKIRTKGGPDLNGSITTHSIVVNGYDEDNFIILDPWEDDNQEVKIPHEQLTWAFASAVIESDALIVQLDR